jgi:putative tricarboxylic transport membrane protein
MRLQNPKDFLAGLLFMSFGGAALVISQSYTIGMAARMGPGYFPRALGILLVVLGALLSLRGFRPSLEPQPEWRWRPLAVVLAGVGLFSLTAQWLGLVLGGLVLVFVSSAASPEFRWREALVSGLIQGAATVAVFVYGLRIPLPVWPVLLVGSQ